MRNEDDYTNNKQMAASIQTFRSMQSFGISMKQMTDLPFHYLEHVQDSMDLQ